MSEYCWNVIAVNHNTYSPLAASLAAYFVYQMATFIQMDVSSNTLSAAHLKNKIMIKTDMRRCHTSVEVSSFYHSLWLILAVLAGILSSYYWITLTCTFVMFGQGCLLAFLYLYNQKCSSFVSHCNISFRKVLMATCYSTLPVLNKFVARLNSWICYIISFWLGTTNCK